MAGALPIPSEAPDKPVSTVSAALPTNITLNEFIHGHILVFFNHKLTG